MAGCGPRAVAALGGDRQGVRTRGVYVHYAGENYMYMRNILCADCVHGAGVHQMYVEMPDVRCTCTLCTCFLSVHHITSTLDCNVL
jgi:hypothetical protein